MPTDEDYQLCEQENANLRNALAWAAERLSAPERDELEKRLDHSIDKGGVTGTQTEDDRDDVARLLHKLVAHTEPLITAPASQRIKASWFARLDDLITAARDFEPKHPVMRRIGGHPNVFAPVKGGG